LIASTNAFHNSDELTYAPKCHPQTRLAVLDNIMKWVNESGAQHHFMMWLFGSADVGKSAIAKKIAELATEQGRSTDRHTKQTIPLPKLIIIDGLDESSDKFDVSTGCDRLFRRNIGNTRREIPRAIYICCYSGEISSGKHEGRLWASLGCLERPKDFKDTETTHLSGDRYIFFP
jgi:hypothetical protein